ncbi:hypothetical protein CLCR_07988 [Cladophialophora carrionii]|uniref:Uncharacterized protein n=1 Tax=Cladophialophora carrionii TaxID=86049 RepID=A0A1C1CTQ2_9EURO|nr:hypothetical protein CLCR_07988 [Cladophialophora carrionii]
MPSKYSHGVVLATYSSRGIIASPNDEQLDYLSSHGLDSPTPLTHQPAVTARRRAPSAPPTHNHWSLPHESNRASKSWRNRFSTPSMSETACRQLRNGAANGPQTLGEPLDLTPRSRPRTLIVDSDEDNVEDDTGSQNLLASAPISPAASAPVDARLSFPFRLASPTLSPMRRPQSSPGASGWPAGAGIGFTKLAREHVPSLPPQKYELGSDLGDQARSPKRHSFNPHTSTGSQSDDCPERLLSTHEFLGFPAQHRKPRGHVTVEEAGAPSTEQAPSSILGTASSSSRAGFVSPDLPASPTSPYVRRDHISFIDMSEDEDDGNTWNEHHLEPIAEAKSVSALTPQAGGHRHNILDLTEEEPLETNDKQYTVPSPAKRQDDANPQSSPNQQNESVGEAYYGGSGDSTEGPMLSYAVLPRSLAPVDPVGHDDKATPQNTAVMVSNQDSSNTHEVTTPVEPDFSHFLDAEELGDPMDGPLTDIYLRNQYYQAFDKDVLSDGVTPKVTPSTSPQLVRDDDRPSRPSTPVRQRTVSVRSGEHSGTTTVGCGACAAGEMGPLSPTGSTTSTQQGCEGHIQKLKSEEEMRMQIPTPIPSPVAYKSRHKLTGSQSRPATQTSIALSNIGMPSVVRLPHQKKQKQKPRPKHVDYPPSQKTSNPRQKQDPVKWSRRWWRDSHSRAASISTPATPSGDVTAVAAGIDSEDEGSERGTLPIAPFYADLSCSEFGPPSKSVTPRPQTANWRPPQPATACRNLLTVFDDISMDHSIESEPDLPVSYADLDDLAERTPQWGEDEDRDEDGEEEYHDVPDWDLDAALPPPDISRHPLDRGSPRSNRTDPRRLSSLTSRSWRTKMKTKRMSMPDHPADTGPRFLEEESRSGLQPRRQRPHAVVAGVGAGARPGPGPGPGQTTGIARLDAIMERAEEEARANRKKKKKKGMRGLWRRFTRRV